MKHIKKSFLLIAGMYLCLAATSTYAKSKKERKHNDCDKKSINFNTKAKLEDILGLTEVGNLPHGEQLLNRSGTPDPILAVGNDRLIAMVNGGLSIYDSRTLQRISEFSFPVFFPATKFPTVGCWEFMADPWPVWDELSERFFIIFFNPFQTIACGQAPASSIYIAVSKTASPRDENDFYTYYYQSNDYFEDFTKIAVDKDALYISTNAFRYEPPFTLDQHVFAFEKAPLLSNRPLNLVYDEHIDVGIEDSQQEKQFLMPIQPRFDCHGNYGQVVFVQAIIDTNLFPFGPNPTSGKELRVHYIENVLTNPVRKTATIQVKRFSSRTGNGLGFFGDGIPQRPPISNPFFQPIVPIECSPLTISTGAQDGNDLWVAQNCLSDDGLRYISRWYQLDISKLLSSSQVTVKQQGNVDDGVMQSMYPAINVDKNGSMGITFAFAGNQHYPSVGYTGRLKTDPLGTVRMPVQIVSGGDLYYQRLAAPGPILPRNRYGDYSGLVVDPWHKTFWLCVEDPVAIAFESPLPIGPVITPFPQYYGGAPFGSEAAVTVAAFKIETKSNGYDDLNFPQTEYLLEKGSPLPTDTDNASAQKQVASTNDEVKTRINRLN